MKFQDLPYSRPNLDEITSKLNSLIQYFSTADSATSQIVLMNQITDVRNEMESSKTIVSIRHSINTTDKFYDTENKFFDENSPAYSAIINKYYKAVVESKFKKELSEEFGPHFFNLAKVCPTRTSPSLLKVVGVVCVFFFGSFFGSFFGFFKFFLDP